MASPKFPKVGQASRLSLSPFMGGTADLAVPPDNMTGGMTEAVDFELTICHKRTQRTHRQGVWAGYFMLRLKWERRAAWGHADYSKETLSAVGRVPRPGVRGV